MRRILITALAVAAPLLSLAVTAAAQPYEDTYGSPGSHEGAARRVTPVSVCPGGGFLAVGTTSSPGTPADVLLVRTNAAGTRLWERTYDVGPGRDDRGRAVAEAHDGTGYVIAGSSRGEPFGQDVLLMKVRCDGEPVWTRTYHGQGNALDEASDIVEAGTGNPAFGTQSGDFLVAGRTRTPGSSVDDALLLRTGAGGNIVWGRRYLTSAFSEELRALTEAEPGIDDQETGDVVAVGQWRDAGVKQGFALRVDGNTGLLGPALPQGAWRYGVDSEGFESVAELSFPFPRQLVMVGSTGSGNASDVFAVRTAAANPGFLLARRRIYSIAGSMSGREVALDVIERSNASPTGPIGRLALTGYADYPTSTSSNLDAFLLLLAPGTLTPTEGELFGDHAVGWKQVGSSLADHPEGFIIAGSSDDGDSLDLYLVNADANGQTNCSVDWKLGSEEPTVPVTKIEPMPEAVLSLTVRQVVFKEPETGTRICR